MRKFFFAIAFMSCLVIAKQEVCKDGQIPLRNGKCVMDCYQFGRDSKEQNSCCIRELGYPCDIHLDYYKAVDADCEKIANCRLHRELGKLLQQKAAENKRKKGQ